MQIGDVVTATFSPRRTSDLRPGVSAHIGWRGQWRAEFWLDDGQYAEQFAMSPVGDDAPQLPWVPECDLSDVCSVDPAASNG